MAKNINNSDISIYKVPNIDSVTPSSIPPSSGKLMDYTVYYNDTDTNSKFFNVKKIPNVLASGKNYFLIAGSSLLQTNAEIRIEAVDSVGNILRTVVPDVLINGTDIAVVVYVYADTYYGNVNVTILGKASDVPIAWKSVYNVKWQTNILCNPTLDNEDDAIFVNNPGIQFEEIYDVAGDISRVITDKSVYNQGLMYSKIAGDKLSPKMQYELYIMDAPNIVKNSSFNTLQDWYSGSEYVVNSHTENNKLYISQSYGINNITCGVTQSISIISNKLYTISASFIGSESTLSSGNAYIKIYSDTDTLFYTTSSSDIDCIISGTFTSSYDTFAHIEFGSEYDSIQTVWSNVSIVDTISGNGFTSDMEGGEVIIHPSNMAIYPNTEIYSGSMYNTYISKVVNNRYAIAKSSFQPYNMKTKNYDRATFVSSSYNLYYGKKQHLPEVNSKKSYLKLKFNNLSTHIGSIKYIDLYRNPGNSFIGRYPLASYKMLITGSNFTSINDFTYNWKSSISGSYGNFSLQNKSPYIHDLPPIEVSYDDNIIFNSIKIQNTSTGSFHFYKNIQNLNFTKDVEYEISYVVYSESTSSAVFDLYISSSNSTPFVKSDSNGFLIDKVDTPLNTVIYKNHIIKPTYSGTGSLCILFKYGTYYISDINIKPYHTNNFSVAETELIVPSEQVHRLEPTSIFPVYISRNGKPIGNKEVTLSDAGSATDYTKYSLVTGSNTVISLDDNLIEGSLFVGNTLRSGVEISGYNNAMIRSVGYQGFNKATSDNVPGFIIYSGSVIPGSGDYYRGLGLELHAGGDSGSFRYRVDDSGSFLEITGSIYATSGYFSGILSASSGFLGGWVIDSSSIYSNTIKLWSENYEQVSNSSAIQFYDSDTGLTYASLGIKERPVITYQVSYSYDYHEYYTITSSTYTPVLNMLKTTYFTMGEYDVGSGSSMIFDFTYYTGSKGDFIVSGAKNFIVSLQTDGFVDVNSPIMFDNAVNIRNFDGNSGSIYSLYKTYNSIPESTNKSTIKYKVPTLSPNIFIMDNINNTVISSSFATIYGVNYGYIGNISAPTYSVYTSCSVADNIYAGVMGESIPFASPIPSALKTGVYGRTQGDIVTGSGVRSIAILGDVYPGNTGYSGVFRYGNFVVGDPYNKFITGSGDTYMESNDVDVVFYVDATRNYKAFNAPYRPYINPNFGRVGILTSTPQYQLHVSGTIYAEGDVITLSDIRHKTNIVEISNALYKIINLQGVSYNIANGTEDVNTNTRDVSSNEVTKIGLIAQEVEKILPEVVRTDSNGYKSINYSNITALLIEGIKSQQKQIDDLYLQIRKLKEYYYI